MINETREVTTLGSGARLWEARIGFRAASILRAITPKASLLPFLKSIKTSITQHKEFKAAIIPCIEETGNINLPYRIIWPEIADSLVTPKIHKSP